MTIMSAQYAYRTGVQVSFVRDKNKKEAYFSNAFVIFSLSDPRSDRAAAAGPQGLRASHYQAVNKRLPCLCVIEHALARAGRRRGERSRLASLRLFYRLLLFSLV